MNIAKNKKILYLLDSFPSIAQTFVIREILEVKKYFPVSIISLSNTKHKKYRIHKQAEELVKETFYFPGFLSLEFWIKVLKIQKEFPEIKINLWNEGKKIYKRLEKANEITSILFVFKALYFASILKKENIEHIHIHFAERETTFGMILATALNIPFSFTAHGRDLYLQDTEKLIEKSQKAKFVVLISEFSKKFFIEKTKMDLQKIFCIYEGINPDEFQYVSCLEKRKVLRETDNVPTMITVGRLVEEKGYTYVLGACKILKEQNIKFQYLIVGKGSNKKIMQLKKLCKKYKIEDCVTILGPKTIEEIKLSYKNSDLFVLGSIREGFPVVLMEALASGIPTVATNITGIPELIKNGENGFLVEPTVETDLAEAIKKLLLDDALAVKFSLTGRKVIEEKFDISKTLTTLIENFANY